MRILDHENLITNDINTTYKLTIIYQTINNNTSNKLYILYIRTYNLIQIIKKKKL